MSSYRWKTYCRSIEVALRHANHMDMDMDMDQVR